MFNFTADGTQTLNNWIGGVGAFWARGTFGGGTLSLQSKPPGATDFLTIGHGGDKPADLTADGDGEFTRPADWPLRVILTGSTSPSIEGAIGGMHL